MPADTLTLSFVRRRIPVATPRGGPVARLPDAGYRSRLQKAVLKTCLPNAVAGAAANPLEDFAAFEAPVAVAIRGEWLDAQALGALQDAAADTSFLRSAWRALEMLPSP